MRYSKTPRINLAGKKVGKLTVVRWVGVNRKGKHLWLCVCECGTEKVLTQGHVGRRRGFTASCGCSHFSLHPNEATKRRLLTRIKINAKRNGRDFSIPREEGFRIISSPCHYCGREPHRTFTDPLARVALVYNGIDRVNNDLGYIPGNVVPCCWSCNKMKADISVADFIQQIQRIAAHLKVID